MIKIDVRFRITGNIPDAVEQLKEALAQIQLNVIDEYVITSAVDVAYEKVSK